MPDQTTAQTITKDTLAQKYGDNGSPLALNTVRQTLISCGLDTSKRTYTSEEESKFGAARKLITEGATYNKVKEHFKVDLEAANAADDAFIVNQATEASEGGDISFEIANAIAETAAKEAVDMVPDLTVFHLNQMMGSQGGESVYTKMQGIVSTIRGSGGESTRAKMMRGIQRLKELPPATTKSVTTSAKSTATKSTTTTAKSGATSTKSSKSSSS